MAAVTIAQVQCDSTLAVAVVIDFLKRRGVDTSTISTPAQARTALEQVLRDIIKTDVVAQRMDDAATTARSSAQTTNNSSVVLT